MKIDTKRYQFADISHQVLELTLSESTNPLTIIPYAKFLGDL